MSYDLLVFDPKIAPRERAEFIAWYRDLTCWKDQSTDLERNLRRFFDHITRAFPEMNPALMPPATLWGRLMGHKAKRARVVDVDDPRLTEYTLTRHAIYMAFAWSQSQSARDAVIEGAIAAGVGFFDVSATEGVIAHDRSDLAGLQAVARARPALPESLTTSQVYKILEQQGWSEHRYGDNSGRFLIYTHEDRTTWSARGWPLGFDLSKRSGVARGCEDVDPVARCDERR